MGFFPDDAVVPIEWRTEDLWLRVLRPDVTELDFAALMESRERLRRWSNSSWPADDFTLDANRQDLIEHEREWEAREAFAYTVLNPDGTRCEGCVYINPLELWLDHCGFKRDGDGSRFDDDTPAVTFWVCDSALARGLDRQLLTGLRNWFQQEWPFTQVVFPLLNTLTADIALLESSGLVLHATHSLRSDAPLSCFVYGESA